MGRGTGTARKPARSAREPGWAKTCYGSLAELELLPHLRFVQYRLLGPDGRSHGEIEAWGRQEVVTLFDLREDGSVGAQGLARDEATALLRQAKREGRQVTRHLEAFRRPLEEGPIAVCSNRELLRATRAAFGKYYEAALERAFFAAMTDGEAFQFSCYAWDVDRTQLLLPLSPRPAVRVPLMDLLGSVEDVAVDEDHAMTTDLNKPLIAAWLRFPGSDRWLQTVIDGHHRLSRALVEGKRKSLPVLRLTPEESLAILLC